jgi:hypothetical protein
MPFSSANSLVRKVTIFAKGFPMFTTLMCHLNALMLNKCALAGDGFVTFALLIKPFRADTRMLNKCVLVTGSFSTFTHLVMSLSTPKHFSTFATATYWMFTIASGMLLKEAHSG